MKKIYNAPSVKITLIQTTRMMLEGSLHINRGESVSTAWGREDNGWDEED